MERPAGVTAIAVLSLLDGLVNFVGGYGALTLGGRTLGAYVLPFFTPPPGGEADAIIYLVLGLLTMLLGLAQLVFAWGAWNLADWAWLLGLGLAGLGVALVVGALLSGAAAPTAPLASLLVPVLVGVYLLVPRTRRAFGLLRPGEAEAE
jgi:hypothetical protein